MQKVILKRSWRTPFGRFDKSINGIPVPVPDKVLAKYALPRDAEIVDESYIPPGEREDPVEEVLSAADVEARINAEVNERVAALEARLRAEKLEKTAEMSEKAIQAAEAKAAQEEPVEQEDPSESIHVLSGSVKEVEEKLSGMDAKTLEYLRDAEVDGRNRKGVLIAIDAALEDLQDVA